MAKAGRGDDQYMVRFPEGLRDRIKEAAEKNGRSMNTEIVERLEWDLAFGREAFDRYIIQHEELSKDHLKLVRERRALETDRDHLKMELAATRASLAEQQMITASLQQLLSKNFTDAKKEADEKAETMAAIDARFNDMKSQAEYLEKLKAELLNLSKEREEVKTEAEVLVERQAEVIDRLSEGQKATATVLATLQKVLRKAADGDDADLAKIVASFSTAQDPDERK